MPQREADTVGKSFSFHIRRDDQASSMKYGDQPILLGSPPDSEHPARGPSRAGLSWQYQAPLCALQNVEKISSQIPPFLTDDAPEPVTAAVAAAGPLGLTAPNTTMSTRTQPPACAFTLPLPQQHQSPLSWLPSKSAPQEGGTGPRPPADEGSTQQGRTAGEGAQEPPAAPCSGGLTAAAGGVSEDLTAALAAACNFVRQLRRQADLAVAPSAQRQRHDPPPSPPSQKLALRSESAGDAAQTELQSEWLRREIAASVSYTERRRRAGSESEGAMTLNAVPTAVQCAWSLAQQFSDPQAYAAGKSILSNGAVPYGAAAVHGSWHRSVTEERLTAAATCKHVTGGGMADVRTADSVVSAANAVCTVSGVRCSKRDAAVSSVVEAVYDVDGCGGGKGQSALVEALSRERARADALAAQVKDLQERLLRASQQPPHAQRTTSGHIRSVSASAYVAAVAMPTPAHVLLPPHPHHHLHNTAAEAASSTSAAAIATATVFASPVAGRTTRTLHPPWAPPGSATAAAVAAVLPYTTSPMRSWAVSPPLASSPSLPPLLASSSLPGLLLHPPPHPHHPPSTPPPPPPSSLHHQPSTQPPQQLQQHSSCVAVGDLPRDIPPAPALSAPVPLQSTVQSCVGSSGGSGSWEAQWQQREAARQREMERRWQEKLDAVVADHKVEMSMMESRHRKEVAALSSQAAAAQARASQLLATVAALQGDVRVCDQLINWLTPEPEEGGQRAVAVAVGLTNKREACAGAAC